MSNANSTASWESFHHSISANEEPQRHDEAADPISVTIGDRFEKRGRRVIEWKVDSIAHLPRVGPIITLAEIDGTARVQVHAFDITEMGFNRVASQPSL